MEVSAFGTAESSTVQWTLDFDKLVAEAGEVLELEGSLYTDGELLDLVGIVLEAWQAIEL